MQYQEVLTVEKKSNHLQQLLAKARDTDHGSALSKVQTVLDSHQEEIAILRFAASTAEVQVKKYDPEASANMTENRRAQIANLETQVRGRQQRLEQRAEKAALVNSKKISELLMTAKAKLSEKQAEFQAALALLEPKALEE